LPLPRGWTLKRRIEAFQVVNTRTAITAEQIATKITHYTLIEIPIVPSYLLGRWRNVRVMLQLLFGGTIAPWRV